jgi:Mg2+-importing ATPase
VVFAIRTRRVPFLRSRPSLPLVLAVVGVVVVGAALPATPIAGALGFAPLPARFFLVLAALVVGYLVLVEVGKRWYYRAGTAPVPVRAPLHRHPHRQLRRRAARFRARRPR